MRKSVWVIVVWMVSGFYAAHSQTQRVLDIGGATMPYQDDPMIHFYPDKAKKANKEGFAKIECRVTETSNLTDCKILSEEPEGYGFGEATIKLFSKVTLKPETIKRLNGAPFTSPVTWKLK